MNNKNSYFLIGGSGFLGNAFSNYLRMLDIIPRNILRGEISDSKSLSFKEQTLDTFQISGKKNVIVDFAYTSVPNTSFHDPVKDFTENLYNINSHLAFANRLPNATYIYISSGGTVYGNVTKRIPITENCDTTPLSPYGITKLASEKYTLMHKEIYGLDTKIVRPSNIYGPGQKPFRGQGFISTAISKMMLNEPIQIFGKSSIRDYLYIEDFCDALFSIIEKGEKGAIYNVGSQEGCSTDEIMRILKNTVLGNKKPIVEFLPKRPFDVKYNVLNCTKVKKINNDFYKISLENGILLSYLWLKDYLRCVAK